MKRFHPLILLLVIAACAPRQARGPEGSADLILPGETYFKTLRQLTFGGENAEAYFDSTGARLIYQSTPPGGRCDRIFIMNRDGSDKRRVSTGLGRTTCSYFIPGTRRILYASTHAVSPDCPPPPDRSHGYVWPLYEYDIFAADEDGSHLTNITNHPGYDAEGTTSPDGSRIVFTSSRDGDLELYSMRPDGGDLKRLTHHVGYDGGAFYSADGKQIVYRASLPQTAEEIAKYRDLLAKGLVRPTRMEIFVMDADGSHVRQVTNNGAANFAPFFHPDEKRIIFSSNMDDPKGRDFDLYLIRVDGTGLKRLTTNETFDGFPMFSPDGKWLAFASNRNGSRPGETNIFLAEWKE